MSMDPILSPPQALFFDLDGTLLDSLPGIAFSIEDAFAVSNLPMQSIDLREAIGPPIRTILSTTAGNATDADLDLLERSFRRSYDSIGWQKTKSYPGARVVLEEAHALGILLFVVSNKPRAVSVKILKRENMISFFTAVLTRDSRDPPYSGKAQMLGRLLEEFELEPRRCVMVGDTAEDADGAAAMKVPFVWVTHGYGKLPASPAVLHRLEAFPELLTKLVKESK